MYTKPADEIIIHHNINYHCYAVDTQVTITLKTGENFNDSSSPTEVCAADVGNWMNSNRLKLNESKTEFIVFSPKQHMNKTKNLRIKMDSSYIKAFASVRNLGLILNRKVK